MGHLIYVVGEDNDKMNYFINEIVYWRKHKDILKDLEGYLDYSDLSTRDWIGLYFPEGTMHPLKQLKFADKMLEEVFINNQFRIISTHSEAFLLRTLRRVREGNINGQAIYHEMISIIEIAKNHINASGVNGDGEIIMPLPSLFNWRTDELI